MKDLPHHVKQLNRKVIRSERRQSQDEAEVEQGLLKEKAKLPTTKAQAKKKSKLQQKKMVESHVPHPQSADERNELMSKRVPIRKKRENFYPNISKPRPPNPGNTK